MKGAKWNKPLSRRAYEKIKEKALIGVTIAGRELDFEEFEETIDIYIEKGKVVLPWCDHHDIYDIIFHMIKDDIDTAMRRSREARERAAARRRAREEVEKSDIREKSEMREVYDLTVQTVSDDEKSGCMCDDIQPDGSVYGDDCGKTAVGMADHVSRRSFHSGT
ncbi:MAG: hypothetical protein HFJ91_09780 [Muribaculaceae bacterium]|nr:hypothetical protein [Muribaculaceae bacterium]